MTVCASTAERREGGGCAGQGLGENRSSLRHELTASPAYSWAYNWASVMSASASWISWNMNSDWYSIKNCVERLTSTKRV